MGLDMYLTKRIYIGAEYEHRNVIGIVDIKIGEIPIKINFNKITYIEESAAYWRKANCIHNWFVQNVQGGIDDCGKYNVSKQQLIELVELCKKVLDIAIIVDDKLTNEEEIEAMLPTVPGFFFGSNDYDEHYIKKLQNTISQLEPIIAECSEEANFLEYQYSSSW